MADVLFCCGTPSLKQFTISCEEFGKDSHAKRSRLLTEKKALSY